MRKHIDWTRAIDADTKAMAVSYAVRMAEMAMERGEPKAALRAARQLTLAQPRVKAHGALLARAEAELAGAHATLDKPINRMTRARAALAIGDPKGALRLYDAEARASGSVDAFLGFAWCMIRMGRVALAETMAQRLSSHTASARVAAILAHVAIAKDEPDRAEAIARAAIAADPAAAALMPYGAAFETFPEIEGLCREIGPALEKISATLHLDQVAAANRERDYSRMARAAEAVLAIVPDDVWAATFAVEAYDRANDLMSAVGAQARLIEIANGHPDKLAGIFMELFKVHAYEEAREIGLVAMELRPWDRGLRSGLIYACSQVGDTETAGRLLDESDCGLGDLMALNPFTALGVTDDPAVQLAATSGAAKIRFTEGALARPAALMAPRRPRRVRIGFFSNDFHEHPVGKLVPGLLRELDRARFEVVVYSYDMNPEDETRARLRAAADRFVDVAPLESDDLVNFIRREKVHALIEMKGFTDNSRLSQIPRRMAPVQASWFGFSATSGTPGMDYIIADPVVAPPAFDAFYSEKVARLPDTFFPYDPTTRVGSPRSRAEHGLPATGFVFASFNQPFKLNEAIIQAWGRILQATPGSVLWLQKRPDPTCDRLRRSIACHGVAPERLIFAPRTPDAADHLARYAAVDLALDTFPYGSHTTSADALFGGAPILTIQGRSFASRVSSSIVTAHGMPQLVTTDLDDYVAKAVAIARDPMLAEALKAQVIAHRATKPLFDAARHAAHFGLAIETMVARWAAGEPPAAFDVPAIERTGAPRPAATRAA